MFVTIINDCWDPNAMGRQMTRAAALFSNAHINFIGVQSDLEASGCLVDALDAALQSQGVILANVAPRNGIAQKRWQNGTPFGYFWYGNILVGSSVGGATLSLAKKLKIIQSINILDIAQSVKTPYWRWPNGVRAVATQFRSYEFLLQAANILFNRYKLPAKPFPLDEVTDPQPVVWSIDNFGNLKTTLLANEVPFYDGKSLKTTFGNLLCCQQLCSVPDGQAAVVIGSSGIDNQRFLEIVVQGGNAAKHFNAKVGDTILLETQTVAVT
jgi:hypothetical protein